MPAGSFNDTLIYISGMKSFFITDVTDYRKPIRVMPSHNNTDQQRTPQLSGYARLSSSQISCVSCHKIMNL